MSNIIHGPKKNLIKKVIADDSKNEIISPEPILAIKKRSRYWMLTIYRENVDDDDEEFTVEKCMESIKTNFKNIDYIVGQLELGKHSKELHIHMAITFNKSTCYPVNIFNKLFPNVYICADKNSIYNSYCMKEETRIDGSTIIFNCFNDKRTTIVEKDVTELMKKISDMEEDISDLKTMCQQNALVIDQIMKMGKLLIGTTISEEQESL